MKRSSRLLVVALTVAIALPWEYIFAAPPLPAAQTSREGGVNVTVVPRNLTSGTPSWDFEVTLETHTQPLNQDMSRVATLIDVQGKSHAPLGWEGDPPGGHHRRGILRFQPLTENPTTVVLRITGVGGIDVRTFSWQLR